jgi:hypothetical protein
MNWDRRRFLKHTMSLGTLSLGSLGLTGCDRVLSWVTDMSGQGIPEAGIQETNRKEIDPEFHLLSRAAFGPWPGDLARLRSLGREVWLEEQLHPEKIDDGLCDLRARRFESLHVPAGETFEFKRDTIRKELSRATLLRAVYSRRQLLEVMVRFWSDHLNIDISKGRCAHLKVVDDREVIRRNALGKFRDLIRASALSPAMLVYLDGTENRFTESGERPNENYGRELLELHTLGVHGGYSQKDVMEAARCLTGWRVREGWRKGEVIFHATAHDPGEKVVLGQTIPGGGGKQDLERLLDIVCGHPSTARHVAAKLCHYFVSPRPPARLLREVSETFLKSQGEIKSLLRTIFSSPEFVASRGHLFKRPFRFVASALRAMAADTHGRGQVLEILNRLGQPLFQYPTPDGYPQSEKPWLGTLLWRWNFSLALASNSLPGARVDGAALGRALTEGGHGDSRSVTLERAFSYLVGRLPEALERRALAPAWEQDPALGAGLMLASPAFQRC